MMVEDELDMEYNTAREMLRVPEYGRNIQKMIEFAMTIPDRDERNRAARSIIKVMGQVNPELKNNQDLTNKLWDHMFIISDFRLDVDTPYPKPLKEEFEAGPDPIPYPENEITYRHYGRVLEQIISKVTEESDEVERSKMGVGVANVMKRAYLNWNRDSVEDRVIISDLRKMSQGKISLPSDTVLIDSKDLIDVTAKVNANPKRQRKGGRNKRKKNTRRNYRN